MRLCSLLLLFLICFSGFAELSSKFPIEVFGKDGTIEQASIILEDDWDAPKATGIKFRMHGLTYENKASIKINDGDWKTLNDDNVIYPKVEAAFWGQGGTQSTLNFIVPVKKGEIRYNNIISFRFNDLDHKTTGYRVLNIEIMAGERKLKLQSFLSVDNPALWKPISTNRADIIMGRELWYNATLRDNGVLLRAKCADCHFENGLDLKLLNFSDNSIIARSMFHELSLEDSKKIASYIRNLDAPYLSLGRPWNGLFQPGPGLSKKPVENWIAGSGVVLENDLMTLKYIFPTGIKGSTISFKDTFNPINVPLVVQFPDLGSWLPEFHPSDAFPDIYTNGHPYLEIYETIRAGLLEKNTPLERAEFFKKQASNWDRASAFGPARPLRENTTEYNDFIKRYIAVRKWRTMKSLELLQEFGLFEYGEEIYGNGAPRVWPTSTGEIFRIAPHIVNEIKNDPNFPGSDAFFSNSMKWYQLQLSLNSGAHFNWGIVPIDEGYLVSLNFSSWNNLVKMPTYGISVLNAIKAGEATVGDRPITDKAGFNPYTMGINLVMGGILKSQFDKIDNEITRETSSVLLNAWLETVEQYSKEEYEQSRFWKEDGYLDFNGLLAFLIAQSNKLGIDQPTIERLEKFAEKVFPYCIWEK